MNDAPQINVKGHLTITDDTGKVLVDKDNAIHPQNMARVIARGLANENNSQIWRIAFGNGGTEVTAANKIEYRTVNDGQPPDQNTWNSRIYNEVYSEIIDDGRNVLNPDIGKDPGHSDINGQRAGGGAVPGKDPHTVPHVSGPGVRSNELGLTSEVVITCVLNQDEPMGQFDSDLNQGTTQFESSFMFDEIGLYTTGAFAGSTKGYQNIDVGNKTSTSLTRLQGGQKFGFEIKVDGGTPKTITFVVPASGGSGPAGEVTYGDICEAINTPETSWNVSAALPGQAKMFITDNGDGSYPSTNGAQTFGYLQFKSGKLGSGSSIEVSSFNPDHKDPDVIDLFGKRALDATPKKNAVDGGPPGVQNDPLNATEERERLLTHIIFSPVLKSQNRMLTITYILTISVARTTT